MNWLFWTLLILTVLLTVRGARKGFVRTAVSMVSMILVMVLAFWLNPYVGDFLEERTPLYTVVEDKTDEVVSERMAKYAKEHGGGLLGEQDFPLDLQSGLIEQLPLPGVLKDTLTEHNSIKDYQQLGVEKFSDYLSEGIARFIVNGIGFILAFVIAMVLVRIILYAADLLMELPVLNFVNVLAGMLLGLLQALLWIWIIFLITAVLCDTSIGKVLMEQIVSSPILTVLYEQNFLMKVITSVIFG